MATLKNVYLDGATGIITKLNEAFELGRKFILPTSYNVVLENAVDIATTSPHFTIKNSGSNSQLAAGFTVKYLDVGTTVEKIIASPLTPGSTFDVTVAPSGALSDKSLTFTSLRPATYTTLSSALSTAAAQGKRTFDVSITTIDNPTYLRLQGDYMKSYFAGILYSLGEEKIFANLEVTLSLDVTDTVVTKVKFSFTF